MDAAGDLASMASTTWTDEAQDAARYVTSLEADYVAALGTKSATVSEKCDAS